MATRGTSLVVLYDELAASTSVLCQGTEGTFSEFVSNQSSLYQELEALTVENTQLKEQVKAMDVNMKLSRNALKQEMAKRNEAEEELKKYDMKLCLIHEILNSTEGLTEAKTKILSLLEERKRRRSSTVNSLGSMLSESCELHCSDYSLAPTDVTATDVNDTLNDTIFLLTSGTRWKRRRTASTETALEISLTKKQKSIDGRHTDGETECLHPNAPLHMTSPLERKFKRPPARKGRRKPSKGHLRRRASEATNYSALAGDDVMNTGLLSDTYADEKGTTCMESSPQLQIDMDPQFQVDMDYQSVPPPVPLAEPAYQSNWMDKNSQPHLYPDLDKELQGTEYSNVPVADPMSVPDALQCVLNMNKCHNFVPKTLVKSDCCKVCQTKIAFSRNAVKCKGCRAVCHNDCREKLHLPCIPTVHVQKKKLKDSELSSFCPQSFPHIPALIVHCVREIENRGLTYVGIYREPGHEKAINELRDHLIKCKGTPNLGEIEDIHTICGCLKDFLHKLKEPLVTFRLHPTFMEIFEHSDEEMVPTLLHAIAQLPPCNKDTLAFVILHLQKVACYSEANEMPVASIAKAFGHIVIGHGSASPDSATMWKDTQYQPKLMELLLSINPDYWYQHLSPNDNPQSPFSSPCSSHSSIHSPATPKAMPVPESPFLGPCVTTPKGRPLENGSRTAVCRSNSSPASFGVTRSLKKGKGNFFTSVN